MKKICLFLTVLIFIVSCFSGCSSDSGTAKNTSNETTAVSNQNNTETDKSSEKETNSEKGTVTTAEAETPIEEAKISSAEATEKIKAFSLEKLGLKGEKDDYKFMVSTKGTTIDKTNYLEVVASIVTEENEDGSISMETKGQYFVSYDGTKILVRNVETGEFSELK